MKALVTGGGGFLGSVIVRMLKARGDEPVVLGRSTYPLLEKSDVQTVQGDIRDQQVVRKACADVDAVFHIAALAGVWGPRSEFQSINVDGTHNVIEACRASGVRKLIYTSSPSVVFGKKAIEAGDESLPYPRRYLAHYPATKAAAERLVLSANGTDLATVAIRPHLIWGPGDPHLIPRIIERANAGRLMQIGDGKNLVDITYVDNAAEAHLLAADRLNPEANCAGRAYFVSQGEPVQLWPWINELLRRVGIAEIQKSVSPRSAVAVGIMLEGVYRILRIREEPPMTRFVAHQLHKSHYFNISGARRDLGYAPAVSTAEGMDRVVAWLKSSRF